MQLQQDQQQCIMKGLVDGARVEITGLVSAPVLNGARGTISGPLDPATGRYPVHVRHPPDAVAAWPAGVMAKACE